MEQRRSSFKAHQLEFKGSTAGDSFRQQVPQLGQSLELSLLSSLSWGTLQPLEGLPLVRSVRFRMGDLPVRERLCCAWAVRTLPAAASRQLVPGAALPNLSVLVPHGGRGLENELFLPVGGASASGCWFCVVFRALHSHRSSQPVGSGVAAAPFPQDRAPPGSSPFLPVSQAPRLVLS